MASRTSDAEWHGDLRSGEGKIRLGSGAYEGQYSFKSRFEEGTGTNPEELIAAAHAGCFSMALSAGLTRSGYVPKTINTTATVRLEKVGEGFKITTIDLNTEADIPNITEAAFLETAESAKKNCPVSQALSGAEIRLQAALIRT